jgi:hypothetical protein
MNQISAGDNLQNLKGLGAVLKIDAAYIPAPNNPYLDLVHGTYFTPLKHGL